MKNLLILLICVASFISCNEDTPIMTQTVELVNDGYINADDRTFLGGFEAGEEGAVTLGPVSNAFRVTHVSFLFGGTGNNPVARDIVLKIYKDIGAIDPGELLFSKTYNVVSSLEVMHNLDLIDENVMVDGGSRIRISIQMTEDGLPSIAHDDDGPTALRNWNTLNGFWEDADDFGYNGDYIIRATIEEEI